MIRFTPGELNVMQILWQHGEQKPPEIQAHYPERIKNSALRSYLTILVNKGHISRKRQGRAFFYKTKTKEPAALKSMLSQMVEVFFHGKTDALVSHLIKTEGYSADQLTKLRHAAHASGESKGK